MKPFDDLRLEHFLPTALGISVSLLLFWIASKRSEGARRERAKAANAEFARTVLRRVVQEDHSPTPEDLQTLADGLAHDLNVRDVDMDLPVDILTIVYSRVSASDLIASERRSEILERLSEAIKQAAGEQVPIERLEQEQRNASRRAWLVSLVGLSASLVGTLVAAYSFPFSNRELAWWSTLFVFMGSLAAIVLFYFARPEIEARAAGRTADEIPALRFERNIVKTLMEHGLTVEQPSGRDKDYDAKVIFNGNPILIEVKDWSGHLDRIRPHIVMNRLKRALEREGAAEAWIIVRDPLGKHFKDPKVKFLSESQLKDKISSSK